MPGSISRIDGKIKFAVVGCGHIGRRHAALIKAHPEAELIALADKLGSGRDLSETCNVPLFSSLDELLEGGIQFHVLSIATPNGLHEEHAIKGLKTGHHVIVEKPMALTKLGCEHMIDEAIHQNTQVFCVMQNRYSPAALWLRNILGERLLGDIYIVQVNCYWNRDERYYTGDTWHGTKDLDGGPLFTQFSHFIDMLCWLFGDLKDISAKFYNFNHAGLTDFEDSGLVHFDFIDGGMGCFNFSTSVREQNLESSMTIIGENGTVKISGQYMDEVQTCRIRDYVMPGLPVADATANHYRLFENVVNVLKGRESINASASEGLKVVDTIERIYRLKSN